MSEFNFNTLLQSLFSLPPAGDPSRILTGSRVIDHSKELEPTKDFAIIQLHHLLEQEREGAVGLLLPYLIHLMLKYEFEPKTELITAFDKKNSIAEFVGDIVTQGLLVVEARMLLEKKKRVHTHGIAPYEIKMIEGYLLDLGFPHFFQIGDVQVLSQKMLEGEKVEFNLTAALIADKNLYPFFKLWSPSLFERGAFELKITILKEAAVSEVKEVKMSLPVLRSSAYRFMLPEMEFERLKNEYRNVQEVVDVFNERAKMLKMPQLQNLITYFKRVVERIKEDEGFK